MAEPIKLVLAIQMQKDLKQVPRVPLPISFSLLVEPFVNSTTAAKVITKELEELKKYQVIFMEPNVCHHLRLKIIEFPCYLTVFL